MLDKIFTVDGKYKPSTAVMYKEFFVKENSHLVGYDCPISEYVYNYKNEIKNIVKCERCGDKAGFRSLTKGYGRFCSSDCANKNNGKAQSETKSALSKEDIAVISSKRKETCLEKYGFDNASKTSVVKDKIKNTFLEKYGVSCSLQNEQVKEKALKTIQKKYNRNNNKQGHIPLEILEKLESKEWLIENYSNKECSINGLAYLLDVDKTTVSGRLRKFGIPIRPAKDSKEEIIIECILQKYNVQYFKKDWSILGDRELDFYIPELNLAIEYNGLYFHSIDYYPEAKDKKKHRLKFDMCEERGIQLIQLTGNNYKSFELLIRAKLNLLDKIYARDCVVKEIEVDSFKEFCEQYHFQGYTKCSIKYGLFYKDCLVGAIGFNSSKTADWELTRLVFGDRAIIGGSSKLLSAFRKCNPGSIVSYSSNSYSNGGVYKKLGFTLENETLFDMWYTKDCNTLLNRRNFQKSRLASKLNNYDSNLTEIHNMLNNKYAIYYGPGIKTWILN